MIFSNDNYYHPMDREYAAPKTDTITRKLEKPLFPVSEIGQTVTEGRGQGTFIQSVTAAIRKGAGRLELSTVMEGSDQGVGAEAYGKHAREALRELAKINEVKLHSVHAPSQIGNVSGMTQQGFSNEARQKTLHEIKKAVDFAKDVTNGSAIVVHTGEFPRVMAHQRWAMDEEGKELFRGYEEEPEEAVVHIVDDRTGQIMQTVTKNQVVSRPVWMKSDKEYTYTADDDDPNLGITKGDKVRVNSNDYIDYEGKKVSTENRVPVFDEGTGRFKVEKKTWKDFVEEAKEMNQEIAKKKGIKLNEFEKQNPQEVVTPEEAFFKATLQIQEGHSKGWALTYARDFKNEIDTLTKLKELRKYYKRIEDATDREEKWKIQKLIPSRYSHMLPPDVKDPVKQIDEEISSLRKGIEYARQASTSQQQQAQEARISQDHAVSIKKYALDRSFDTLAKSGITAMKSTEAEKERRKKTNIKEEMRDIYVAPENIFPEMGYGSHPEELIEIVEGARKKMVELLTSKKIKGKWDAKNNRYKEVDNPYYKQEFEKDPKKAKKEAEDHIKATFDTQHLGMWRKHFQSRQGETEEETTKRFNKWYMGQVENMHKKGIIGNIHIVDGWGYGHTHLPAGQGNLPVVDAVTYLKKKGYVGAMSSEGFGEPTRQLTETWRAFGANVYGSHDRSGIRVGATQRWSDIQNSYFGRAQSPYFVFGAYSPSNDWTLWSQTPME